MRKALLVVGALAVLCVGLSIRSRALAAPRSLHVLAFSSIPGSSSTGLHPIASAAGPSAGDVLIAGFDFTSENVLEAIVKATGQPDATIGSRGVLPLPAGYPASHGQVGDIQFLGNTIYAALYANTTSDIYVVSWNAHGHLNSGFGSGGLATIQSPSTNTSFVPVGLHIVLSGGRLIVGGVAGVDVALTPLDPTTGAVGATTVEPSPPGSAPYVNGFRAMQIGPDGNLYALGTAGQSTSSDGIYYGIFNASTLGTIAQTTFADGSNVCGACGEGLAFLGNTVYLGDSSGTFKSASAHLWSAPVGSTAPPSGPLSVPSPVAGANQSLIALTPGPPGALYITVTELTSNSAGSYVMETDGSTFGSAVLVAKNTVATTAVPDPGDDEVAGFTATENNGHSSYTGGFVSIVGEGAGCTPTLKILKTVEPYANPEEVRLVPRSTPPAYDVATAPYGTRSPLFAFIIYVTNESGCEATDVVVNDIPGTWVNHVSGSELLGPPAQVVPPPLNSAIRVRVEIPSLPPGATFEYRILARLTSGITARTDNTAAISGGPSSTVFIHPHPEPMVTSISPGANQIRGTAAPLTGFSLVWVALQWAFSGASDANSHTHCRWLTSTKPTFTTLPCNKVVWVQTRGTKHWRLIFRHRLPRGRYTVFAIALGKHGLSADSLTLRAGDVKAFRVR